MDLVQYDFMLGTACHMKSSLLGKVHLVYGLIEVEIYNLSIKLKKSNSYKSFKVSIIIFIRTIIQK